MGQFIQPIAGLLTGKATAATLPTPGAAGDGIDITPWRTGATPRGYPMAAVAIVADGVATVDNPALFAFGPYGIGGASQWMFVSFLNGNAQIVLSATLGFIQQIDLPSVFTRLCVGGTVGGGGHVGYTATPLAVHQ